MLLNLFHVHESCVFCDCRYANIPNTVSYHGVLSIHLLHQDFYRIQSFLYHCVATFLPE
jgi:hypothetical protein